MKKYITLFLLIFILIKLPACLNELRVNLKGKAEIGDDMFYVPNGRDLEDKTYYSQRLHKLDSLWKANGQIEDYLDYGVQLVYLGRYKEAREVFISAEKMHPGLYATAANLGTTYELLGNNEWALQWIKKAVEIEPESHEGSEWLHIKILEAKIKGESYITSDFLISTNFGNGEIPVSSLPLEEIVKLRYQIFYQLNERVTFIEPQDKIIALLLFELGNTCALLDDVTSALRVYDEAKRYGYSTSVFEKRYRKFLEIHKGYDHTTIMTEPDYNFTDRLIRKWEFWVITGVLSGVAIGCIYLYFRKKNRRK